MKLSKFTNSAMEELKTQAVEHLFYAESFDRNIENVENFEGRHQVSLQDLELAKNYLMHLLHDGECHPLVLKNIDEYLTYLRQNLAKLESEKRKRQTAELNGIITFLNDAPKNYEDSKLRRHLLCSNCLSRLRVHLADSKKMEQEMVEFIPKEFSYSTAIINQEDDMLLNLLQDKVFLQYCNFLLNTFSPLLYMNCFSDQVISVLETNEGLKEYNQDEDGPIMPASFFRENKQIMKRIRNLSE